jgi:hypothetical protein
VGESREGQRLQILLLRQLQIPSHVCKGCQQHAFDELPLGEQRREDSDKQGIDEGWREEGHESARMHGSHVCVRASDGGECACVSDIRSLEE